MSTPTYLDVRLEESFQRGHLPGAVLNPVFQMGFPDRIPKEWPRDLQLVVYGEDADSAEAGMALEKLRRAGFTRAEVLDGGYRGWVRDGHPVESESPGEPPRPAPLHGSVTLDLKQSEVQWTGRNLLNRHYGTLRFSEARLDFDHDQLVGGSLVIDWNSLQCLDLAGDPLHDVLIQHLRDHDFFDVDTYTPPRAELKRAEALDTSSPGSPDLRIEADLTVKDHTRPVSFTATSGRDAEGRFALQAAFEIDRTDWQVRYGSGRFFKGLGMHLVNDHIELALKLVTA